MSKYSARDLALFIIPSVVGVLLFMVPVQVDGSWTIIVKLIADWIGAAFVDWLPLLCVIILTISAIMALVLLSPRIATRVHPNVVKIFGAALPWPFVRIAGAIFIWLVYLGVQAGDADTGLIHTLTSADAGGFVLSDLLTVLVIIFAIAGLLLPLLLDFGLLEFIGALLTKFMRPVFKIPGRSAVDCITSWIGDGTLGVMLTNTQYEAGYYSAREASIIATTFSAVSITFSMVVLAQVDMMEYFGVYYLLICAVGIICALIMPRIPPLSRKKDSYLVEGKAMPENLPEGYGSSLHFALDLAIQRVQGFGGLRQFLTNGLINACSMWFGVLPVVMCIGTIALAIANNTDIFVWLGAPFMPLLELLQVPEAAQVSQTMIVGFVDMFTPSIIAAEICSVPMAKFIVAVISVTQLIYLSEVGGLILGSKIPINLLELFVLFLERTLISLLIVVPVAHLIF